MTTTWDLSWPPASGKNISSALGGLPGPLCITTLTTADPDAGPDLPVNVTSAYTEDNKDSTSCVPALGEEWVRALLSARRDAAVLPPSNVDRGCYSPAKRWTEIPESASPPGQQEVFEYYLNTSTLGVGSANRISE